MQASHLMKFGKLTAIVSQAVNMELHKDVYDAWHAFADVVAGQGKPATVIVRGHALIHLIEAETNLHPITRATLKRIVKELAE